MTEPSTGVERSTAERAADRIADRIADTFLLAAVSAGALVSLLRTLNVIDASVGSFMLWGAVPPLLVLAAYLFTAASEGRAGIRRQRGAVAALTGLAVLSVPFVGFHLAFSPVYGLCLIALAVRTRGTLAAATGVLALGVSLAPALSGGTFTELQAMASIALVAVAAAAAAVRGRRKP